MLLYKSDKGFRIPVEKERRPRRKNELRAVHRRCKVHIRACVLFHRQRENMKRLSGALFPLSAGEWFFWKNLKSVCGIWWVGRMWTQNW